MFVLSDYHIIILEINIKCIMIKKKIEIYFKNEGFIMQAKLAYQWKQQRRGRLSFLV